MLVAPWTTAGAAGCAFSFQGSLGFWSEGSLRAGYWGPIVDSLCIDKRRVP